MEQFYLSFYFGGVIVEDLSGPTVKSGDIKIFVDGSACKHTNTKVSNYKLLITI